MIYDLTPFESLVDQKYLRSATKNGLVLYTYTDKCTFDRNWTTETRKARGVIFEKETGKLIAKPFEKFFNLNEMSETRIENLPACSYTVAEKMDGSLGTLFHYGNQWQIATKGSFSSIQAVKAMEILRKYDLTNIPTYLTLNVEIIYPQNKIIVNYKDLEQLVLLAAHDIRDESEVSIDVLVHLAQISDIPLVSTYNLTIKQMCTLQSTLQKDQEGFVVRYSNGLRLKIKGNEYMRIARLIANMSPLALWETMSHGKVDISYIQALPEELRPEYEIVVFRLESSYTAIENEINQEFQSLGIFEITSENRKKLGLMINNTKSLKHPNAMFAKLLNNSIALDRYILRAIKPIGNVLTTVVE